MFTDTHCHFSYLGERGFDTSTLLKDLTAAHFPCVIDAGTKADDLPERARLVKEALSRIEDIAVRTEAAHMLRFTAGIWPDADAVRNRFDEVARLTQIVESSLAGTADPLTGTFLPRIVSIGECGHDHHWDIAGTDHRDEADFASDTMIAAESELFEMQIELASKHNLPVMVHTRDAFEDSYGCIRNMGYHNGEIHCFSYTIEEAEKFLDLGWYIALGGAVTYTKKSRQEAMNSLIRYIPDDRLLLETDAPYLAPVPERGKPNTPLFIEHTYRYIAERRGISAEELAALVLKNTQRLYGI